MAGWKHFRFQRTVRTHRDDRCFVTNLRDAGRALVILGMLVAPAGISASQQNSDKTARVVQLELEKLALEVEKLKQETSDLPGWEKLCFSFLGGGATTLFAVWAARRARFGALDKSVHDKRLEAYPRLMRAGAPLAVYFPHSGQPLAAGSPEDGNLLSPEDCKKMGQDMSNWYFEHGGLLLSVEARDAYFRLARALTLASQATRLRVPRFPEHATEISVVKLKGYAADLAERERKRRGIHDTMIDRLYQFAARLFRNSNLSAGRLERVLNDVENWPFSFSESKDESPGEIYRDYVFLQRLTSRLRSRLSEDLHGRQPPS
jgi:hypothetical protein